jgi:hypothetical protein
MKQRIFFAAIITLALFSSSCKKTETAPVVVVDPCKGISITPVTSKTNTITGQSLGTITITSPVGSGYLYKIDGRAFQPSVNFFNLATGSYTVTVKNADSCKGSVTVAITGYGAKFYAVRTLINGYCGPCHLSGAVSGGKNFDSDDAVLTSWDRIKARAVDGAPSFMPQGGQLTAIDKQKIADWVNAGHKITD